MDKEARVECLLGSFVWNVVTRISRRVEYITVKVKERVIEGGS